jgi:hypothetical protein
MKLTLTKLPRMKRNVILILVAVVIAGLFACTKKSSDTNTPAPSGIVGTWERTYQSQLLTVVINANGTSGGTWGSIPLPSGTYTVSGNTFSTIDPSCNFYGKYTFALAGNLLTLTLVADSCDGRYQMVPGIYTRK